MHIEVAIKTVTLGLLHHVILVVLIALVALQVHVIFARMATPLWDLSVSNATPVASHVQDPMLINVLHVLPTCGSKEMALVLPLVTFLPQIIKL